MTTDVFIADAVRTPIGKYAGGLARVRPDDLAASTLKSLLARNSGLDPARILGSLAWEPHRRGGGWGAGRGPRSLKEKP